MFLFQGQSILTCPEPTAPTAFLRLFYLLLNSVPLPCNIPIHVYSNQSQIQHPTENGDSIHPFEHNCENVFLDKAKELVSSLSLYSLDVAMIRLFASQLLINSSPNSNASTKIHGSVISALCLSLFDLIPQLLRWPDECKASFLIMDLRLLEIVTFACLELGHLIVPDATESSDGRMKHPNGGLPASPNLSRKVSPGKIPNF